MKFYVINLKRASERWQHMTKQFNQLGLVPTRVEAIDGKRLNLEDLKLYQRGIYCDLYDSEIACFLSHRKCWQFIVDGEEDYAFVFEDDVHLSSLLNDFIKLKIWEQSQLELLSIEQFYPKIQVRPRPKFFHAPFTIYEVALENFGAGGYLVSKNMAKILLKHSVQFYHIVDSFLFSTRRIISAKYGSYQLNPALCIQGYKNENFKQNNYIHPSTMTLDRNLVLKASFARKNFSYYSEKFKIYSKRFLKKIGSKQINIDFYN